MMPIGRRSEGSTPRRPCAAPASWGAWTAKVMPFLVSFFTSSVDSPLRMSASWRLPSRSMTRTCLPSGENDTFSTRSWSMASRKVEKLQGELRGVSAMADCAFALSARPAAREPSRAPREERSSDMCTSVGAAGWLATIGRVGACARLAWPEKAAAALANIMGAYIIELGGARAVSSR